LLFKVCCGYYRDYADPARLLMGWQGDDYQAARAARDTFLAEQKREQLSAPPLVAIHGKTLTNSIISVGVDLPPKRRRESRSSAAAPM
jgi:hypothetical protein